MKQFECRYCQHTIQFGVDVKGVGEIADFIRRHEETCIANDEPIVLPIAVRKLKHGNKRLLKLTGTIFSPGECLNSIKEAASRIEKITRVKRSLKAVRNFLKINLNLRYRKVGGIPAKADSEKQKRFLDDHLEPLLKKARKGSHVILFVDAAHFVHSAFLGFLWSAKRIFVKTPSGRKRFNVLGAVNAITRELHYICNDTYINAETVCDLLKDIAKNYSGKTITLVLDNARYQKCRLVTSVAIELKINLLFLPSYSPNLNLIERLWKFIKKQSLNSKYYEKFSEFQNAILQSLEKANGEWRKELRTLLTLKFQTFSIEKNEDVA